MTTILNTTMNNHDGQFNINLLNKYMLNQKNINIIIGQRKITPQLKTTTTPTTTKCHTTSQIDRSLFFPDEKDSLFWCFYIMKYGVEAYTMLEYKNIVVEKNIKIECIELVRKNKLKLKAHKGMSVSHVENALLNEKIIDMKTFMSLCIIEGISVMYLHKNTYYELNLDIDETTNIHSITRLDNPLKYGYELKQNSKEIRDTFYNIDNLNKPLKAMSSYKIAELIVFCNKLNIPLKEDKKRKKDMYELLIQYFSL